MSKIAKNQFHVELFPSIIRHGHGHTSPPAAGFDEFCGQECRGFDAERRGRSSLPPGVYFRLMRVGFFEGLDSERAIAWGAADSLSVREFVGYGLNEATPDHVTLSRTRRLMDAETHQRVFG